MRTIYLDYSGGRHRPLRGRDVPADAKIGEHFVGQDEEGNELEVVLERINQQTGLAYFAGLWNTWTHGPDQDDAAQGQCGGLNGSRPTEGLVNRPLNIPVADRGAQATASREPTPGVVPV